MEIVINRGSADTAINKIKDLNFDKIKVWNVKITPYKSIRSLEQNDYYWKLVEKMADYIGIKSKEEMHELLAYEFLSQKKIIANKKIITIVSTSKLNMREFNNYLEKVKFFAKDKLGFKLGEEEI